MQFYANDEECQKNGNKRLSVAKIFHESMKNLKTTTTGVLFIRGKILLDEELWDNFRSRKKEMWDETKQIVQNSAQVYQMQKKFIATKLITKCYEDVGEMKNV